MLVIGDKALKEHNLIIGLNDECSIWYFINYD